MSCFSPPHHPTNSSSRPKKPWRGLVSALQKKVTNANKSKAFNGTTNQCTSVSSYHRHCHHQMNSEPLLITGVVLRVGSDDTSDLSQGKGGVVDNLEDDNDNDGVIVPNERVKLHGVDANAEEFIGKMREYWKLERQKSVENYSEIGSRFYKH